jgi:hypothetical protein
MNSNNFVQRRLNSFFVEERIVSIKSLFTYLLLQVTCALNHVRIQQPRKINYAYYSLSWFLVRDTLICIVGANTSNNTLLYKYSSL